jgi:glycerol-3-phosphate dehydrogenase
VYAARNDQAHDVGDVLLRRTRLGLLAGRWLASPGAEEPLRVARVMGSELGWDESRVAREADRWYEEAAAEGIGGEPHDGGVR